MERESSERITYGETRRINIGDYESVDMFMSVSTIVERPHHAVLEAHSSKTKNYDSKVAGSFEEARDFVIEAVKSELDLLEYRVRKESEAKEWNIEDSNTEKKKSVARRIKQRRGK